MISHRKSLGAVLAVVLLVTVGGGSAAAGPKITIVSRSGLPKGVSAGPSPCSNGGTPKSPVTRVKGPDKAPLGTGSLQVTNNAHSIGSVLWDLSAKELAHATTLKISTHSITGGLLLVGMQFTNGADSDIIYTSVANANWVTTNLLTASYQWSNFGTGDELGNGTLAQFLAAQPNAKPISWGALDLDCTNSATSSFAVDAFQRTISGTTTVIDFEPLLAPSIAGKVSNPKVKAGDKIILSVTLQGQGKPLKKQKVSLLRESAGDHKYSKVKSATTDKHGVATATQRPITTSKYEWAFAGNKTFGPKTSKAKLVKVTGH